MQVQMISSIERDRKYAWDYFSQHSSQRMSTFNFYITLALATITAECVNDLRQLVVEFSE
jgi:hypothetical protein